jgi:hypothetical protein
VPILKFVRPLRLVVPLLALAALFASPALARPAATDGLCLFDAERSSEHFVVHFTTNTDCGTEQIFEPQAGETLAAAESAYAAIVSSWGYKAPVTDVDGKTDIYVYKVTTASGDAVDFRLNNDWDTGAPSVGYFELTPESALDRQVVANGVFHVVALAYRPIFQEWLLFGSAQWAGLRAESWPENYASMLTVPEIALDCYSTACDEQLFDYNGQARWPFFVYLQDRFGANAVREVWEKVESRATGAPDGLGALQDYLTGKGTTLTAFFNDFAGTVAKGDLSASSLKGKPPTLAGTITTGAAATTLAPVKVAVNHLAAKFVAIVPGTGKTEACHPATLTVTVDVPAGVGSVPKWAYTGPGGGLTAFTVFGTQATYSTAWDTCTWKDERRGLVSLPHPGTSGDGKEFKVTATISAINTSVVLSPDAPVELPDPRLNVDTPDAAPPHLSLHAPAVIRVDRSRRLRLHLYSSNEGFVRLVLDGRNLGSVAVRAGQNVFRFKLPQVKAPRRRVAERSRLSLTALSSSGMRGGTVSRRLVFAR